ncbi:DNA-binding protein [Aromatoleum toluclasticum]|uniref:DNA-binding protein n=1 Tax=Aromatoleum toluclasticum TaxID=92003 RepID=UPI0003693624|nr:DNA-binding protein [Aromatoleum toluclasticum]
MARSGIYKSEVVRARDALRAQGRHPSIDAIRVELGNTGSKATIHRYLKEIEEEEGGASGTQVAVSEAIQDLIGRLASRLHEEADARIAEARTRYTAEIAQLKDGLQQQREEGEALKMQWQHTEALLSEERDRHRQTAHTLQQETVQRAQAAQQVADLQSQLAQGEQHRQSLEDKHRHAREALDHFRQAAKEQRDQEQRQHEQQIQHLQAELRQLNQTLGTKQDQLTGISRDNARLAAELSQAHAQLHQIQTEARSLRDELGVAKEAEQRAEALGRRLAEQELRLEDVFRGKSALEATLAEQAERRQALEIELAAARASLAIQEKVMADLHTRLPRQSGRRKRSGQQDEVAGVSVVEKIATPNNQ